MEKIELDAYVHCRECVMESGDQPYTQHIEVGVINQNTLVVNCNIHDEGIKSFKSYFAAPRFRQAREYCGLISIALL